MAPQAGKDSITCHVLDTTAGRPAKGIRVVLEQTSSSAAAAGQAQPATFEARTDDDGRITRWQATGAASSSLTVDDVLASVKGASRWALRFDTESYFGEGKTFFPEATIIFRVDEGQHYHVPLLLSPYSYTTYRGS
ncbi:transthyretin domain-containingprotein [Purpureocillium lilacinum]|uniref:5-hydroxyisourate hydrolase n=1 Tax=Purpureocillium lilacinum TaxID=33203 RepID=A0A179GUG0_PURLI|nr:transthyretin domain-containingprotein [Purpureocillium lilacinum]OAQ80970.1 transthyretin domain-containingprotein [Purpureocillium lilacinum]